MIRLERYDPTQKQRWDEFVKNAKNGVFLFQRDFMDYHSDRFKDHSILVFKGKKLIALLPANETGNTLYSHQGLTFGGFVTNKQMGAGKMLDIFLLLKNYLIKQGFEQFIYKPVPHIYHCLPAEEDLYAVFRLKGQLYYRNISSVIFDGGKSFQGRALRQPQEKAPSVSVGISDDFPGFMSLLEDLLHERYETKPVHTLQEIIKLKHLFPDHIKLFTATVNDKLLGGCIIFESKQVAHAQYIASSEEGKKQKVLQELFNYLIKEVYAQKKYFDFGTSNENMGLYLNKELIRNKESYGARSVVYDAYKISL